MAEIYIAKQYSLILFGLALGPTHSATKSIHFFTQTLSSFLNTLPYHLMVTDEVNRDVWLEQPSCYLLQAAWLHLSHYHTSASSSAHTHTSANVNAANCHLFQLWILRRHNKKSRRQFWEIQHALVNVVNTANFISKENGICMCLEVVTMLQLNQQSTRFLTYTACVVSSLHGQCQPFSHRT